MNYKGELELKLRNRQNNARGHFFEQGIIAACHWYSEQGMNVITKKQEEILENHQVLGAVVGVCVGIGEDFFFVPWDRWTRMKELFGRKTATAGDLKEYRVKYRHGIEFLGGMEL